MQWGFFAAAIIWTTATIPLAGPTDLWPIYGAGVLLVSMLAVMMYRMFITANLVADAMNRFSASLAGASKKNFLGKSGHGILPLFIFLVVLVGVAVDHFANLPVKFASVLWYGAGLTVVWAVATVVWRWLRKRFG